LPVVHAGPPPIILEAPRDGAAAGPGLVAFEWGYFGPPTDYTYELVVAEDPGLTDVVLRQDNLTSAFYIAADAFDNPGRYYWNVQAVNEFGTSTDADGPWSFTIDPSKAPFADYVAPQPGGPLVASPLDGNGAPRAGLAPKAGGSMRPATDRFGVPNKAIEFWWYWSLATMRYRLPAFPEKDYTFTAWIKPAKEGPRPAGDLWLFSAWCAPQDDPLRVVINSNGLVAIIETDGKTFATPPVPVEAGEWAHLAVVKAGNELAVYVGGDAKQTIAVPEAVQSGSGAIGLSSNPAAPSHPDRFVGCVDDFAFYARALGKEEVARLAKE